MNERLFYAPIGESPQRVLDIATGTGIWAIEFGMVFGRKKPGSMLTLLPH